MRGRHSFWSTTGTEYIVEASVCNMPEVSHDRIDDWLIECSLETKSAGNFELKN